MSRRPFPYAGVRRLMAEISNNDTSLELAVIDLSLAIGQLRRRLRNEIKPSDLNLSQMGVLVRLSRHGCMTTADLARAETMKPQSMGTILGGLEGAGLVRRQPHPTDGRQVQFEITESGMNVLRAYKLAKQSWMLSAMKKLSAGEQRQLILAIKLIKRLSES